MDIGIHYCVTKSVLGLFLHGEMSIKEGGFLRLESRILRTIS